MHPLVFCHPVWSLFIISTNPPSTKTNKMATLPPTPFFGKPTKSKRLLLNECLFVSVRVRRGGYLIKFNSIVISLFSVQMGKLLSACACITQWIDFAPSFKHTTFPYNPFYSSSSCDREICVMKSRVSFSLLLYAWVCQILFTLPFYPPDRFCFVYAKYLLACSTCLLCTTLFLLVFV